MYVGSPGLVTALGITRSSVSCGIDTVLRLT